MENKIKVKIRVRKPWQVSKGHHQHLPGAGCHGDRRLKRLKTRQAQCRAAFSE